MSAYEVLLYLAFPTAYTLKFSVTTVIQNPVVCRTGLQKLKSWTKAQVLDQNHNREAGCRKKRPSTHSFTTLPLPPFTTLPLPPSTTLPLLSSTTLLLWFSFSTSLPFHWRFCSCAPFSSFFLSFLFREIERTSLKN